MRVRLGNADHAERALRVGCDSSRTSKPISSKQAPLQAAVLAPIALGRLVTRFKRPLCSEVYPEYNRVGFRIARAHTIIFETDLNMVTSLSFSSRALPGKISVLRSSSSRKYGFPPWQLVRARGPFIISHSPDTLLSSPSQYPPLTSPSLPSIGVSLHCLHVALRVHFKQP